MKAGRKPNPHKDRYSIPFGLTFRQRHQKLTERMLRWLDGAKDDDARRVLLGIKEKP